MGSFDDLIKKINDDRDAGMLLYILVIEACTTAVTLYFMLFITWVAVSALSVIGVIIILSRKDKIVSPVLRKKDRAKLDRYMQTRSYYCSVSRKGEYEMAVFDSDGQCQRRNRGQISELAEKSKRSKKARITMKMIKYMYDAGNTMSQKKYRRLVR